MGEALDGWASMLDVGCSRHLATSMNMVKVEFRRRQPDVRPTPAFRGADRRIWSPGRGISARADPARARASAVAAATRFFGRTHGFVHRSSAVRALPQRVLLNRLQLTHRALSS